MMLRKLLSVLEDRPVSQEPATAIILGTGITLIAFVTLAHLLAATALIMGLRFSQGLSILILLAAFALAGWTGAREAPAGRRPVISLSFGFLLLSLAAAALLSDTSIDGQWYHFQAIAALLEGWNPYHQAFTGTSYLGTSGLPVPDLGAGEIGAAEYTHWAENYPHAHWLVMTLPVSAGLPLEASKYIQFLLIAGAGMTAYGALRHAGLSILTSLLIALTMMCNPVALVQLFTRMNDGLLASSLLAFCALCLLWLVRPERRYLALIALVIAFAVGLKFSAIPVFAAACGLALLATWSARGLKTCLQPGLVMAGAGIIGVFGIGFSPYIQNILEYGHPFYPLMAPQGVDTIDIVTGIAPPAIEGRSGLDAFFFSIFAQTHPGWWPEQQSTLKLPFTVSLGELFAAGTIEGQVGGFGPLFSGACLLALGLAGFLLVRARQNKVVRVILGIALAVFVLTALFPESWWARYVPQLWLVPASIALAGLVSPQRPARLLAFGVIGVMLLNAAMAAGSNTARTFKRDLDIAAQIERFAAISTDVAVQPQLAVSRIHVLRRHGFNVTVDNAIDRDSCAYGEEIAAYAQEGTGGYICIR